MALTTSQQTNTTSSSIKNNIYSLPDYLTTTNTLVGALSIGNSTVGEIVDYGVRTNFKSATTRSSFNALRATQKAWRYNNVLGKTGKTLLNASKGAGIVLGAVNITYSIANVANYYYKGGSDWRVLAKNGLDIAMTGVSFLGPIGLGVSATYFIIDAATDGFGGFGSTKNP